MGVDGNKDDITGLINYMKGVDYFDYNGSDGSGKCNITEDRESILADIYHSQLIEVGAPNASTNFKGNNEEAYWRSSKGYQNFKVRHQRRAQIIYAGSKNLLRDIPVNRVKEFESEYLRVLNDKHSKILSTVKQGKLTDEVTNTLEKVCADLVSKF